MEINIPENLKRNLLQATIKFPKFSEGGTRPEVIAFIHGALFMKEVLAQKNIKAELDTKALKEFAETIYQPYPPLDFTNNKGRTGQ